MSKKIKIAFSIIGGVVILTTIVFLWRHFPHKSNSPSKDGAVKIGENISESDNEEEEGNTVRPAETNALQKSVAESNNNLNPGKSLDEDDENDAIADSDDEEETDDNITVETESDDE